VGTVNVTVRFSEEELQRLDELTQRMNKTRSDVIRDLISRFDEVLKQEVEKEQRRWMTIGFIAALESEILDPEVVLRFVRRNVDVLGYPDFVIGMVRVRNRVVLFSHHDRIGNQLLQQVRAKVEEDVRKEEEEIEREGGEDEEDNVDRAMPVRIRASRPARPNTVRAIPVAAKYKLISNNKGAPPTVKPTATSTVGRVTTNNGGGAAKAAGAATVPENKKLVATGIPATNNSAASQVEGSNPQASVKGGATGPSGPVEETPVGKPAGDFVLSLVTHSYHKYRSELLRLVESVIGG